MTLTRNPVKIFNMLNKMLTNEAKKTGLVKVDITKLAKKINRTRTWVSLVWHGHRKSIPTRKAIAEALGVPYEELWEDK